MGVLCLWEEISQADHRDKKMVIQLIVIVIFAILLCSWKVSCFFLVIYIICFSKSIENYAF